MIKNIFLILTLIIILVGCDSRITSDNLTVDDSQINYVYTPDFINSFDRNETVKNYLYNNESSEYEEIVSDNDLQTSATINDTYDNSIYFFDTK